jgi:hypothetical protein
MKNKVELLLRENVMLFQKKRVDLIHSCLVMEGFEISNESVKAIYDKTIVPMADITAANAVLNLKEGCREIIQNLRGEVSLEFLKTLNKEIARDDSFDWGVLRNSRLFLQGTDYVPEIPQESDVELKIGEILKLESDTEKALNLFSYLLKNNIFWGRNISLSFIVANKIMIEAGCGIIFVEEDKIDEFKSMYMEFLDSDSNKEQFINYVYDSCICTDRVDRL